MRTLVFFLEEPSAAEMLKGLLPKILPGDIHQEFKIFEGKQDLEKNLQKRLRAWKKPDCLFLVLRDQDSGNCKSIKKLLSDMCRKAGRPAAVVRIACRELESFYLGDLAAVEQGLGVKGLAKKQGQEKYRTPDCLPNPSAELEKITDGRYQKMAGSRSISCFLGIEGNKSRSFNVLLAGIRKLVIAS